jgi:hypothetical protein
METWKIHSKSPQMSYHKLNRKASQETRSLSVKQFGNLFGDFKMRKKFRSIILIENDELMLFDKTKRRRIYCHAFYLFAGKSNPSNQKDSVKSTISKSNETIAFIWN